jgi:anti-sigma factor (TIGR02949 family)
MEKNEMSTGIDCEQALRQIFQYLDHELGAHEHAEMEKHLRVCKSCFSRAEFERRLQSRLGELIEQEASPTLRERLQRLLTGF